MRTDTALAASLHAAHDRDWRTPSAVATQWGAADAVDPRLLRATVRGAFWETLAAQRLTLLVTREYEHLVVALHAGGRAPRQSYLPLPHPSGMAVDARRGVVYVASTRNPNQIFELRPAQRVRARDRSATRVLPDRPLLPVATRTLPGGTYIHDLALIGGVLHANAVGENAVIRVPSTGPARRVWWPRSIDSARGPRVDRNWLQLNSIAAGATVRSSYFTASTDRPGRHRPGDPAFAVDRRGVVFAGASREVVVRGLTRPHSARLHRRQVWLDNSGYGEFGVCDGDRFIPLARPGGWTRGLAFARGVAFVGTSRVLSRFSHFAPGLDPVACACGVHAIDIQSGRVLGSLLWPLGNQVFAIAAVPDTFTRGLPFSTTPGAVDERDLFYGFTL